MLFQNMFYNIFEINSIIKGVAPGVEVLKFIIPPTGNGNNL